MWSKCSISQCAAKEATTQGACFGKMSNGAPFIVICQALWPVNAMRTLHKSTLFRKQPQI